ncbi:CocE/NonD family hydrolase [Planobispora siamensis]|uniref:X-Pro dipeptidyl-peptidase n=1 Tax=Planobispora siamensis TaxID=936338 RepID=A0A8J3WKY8_9ACTN|nr:CocE/NonD family hydrolase [Planobispora siamensis]GIH94684.1 X-Pro dipeptidyl-peptidase [Planobispora siamensis]
MSERSERAKRHGGIASAADGHSGVADAAGGGGYAGEIRTGLTVTAADGTVLVADLVLPDRLPAPAVVVRTPYGAAGGLPEARSLAEAGFACLLQDLRGRHLSGGVFVPGADETGDGHATLDWTAAQPWCDGDVFLYGLAYEAYAAWCAAAHPAVRGIVSRQPWPPAGPPALDDELWWRTDLGAGRATRPGLYEATLAHRPELAALIPAAAVTGTWPVDVGPWPVTPDTYGPAARRMTGAAQVTRVPSLHLGSWYCRSARTTLRQAMASPYAEAVVGGWASALTHRLQPECALPEPPGPHPFALALEWLDAVRRDGHPLDGVRRGGCLLLGTGRWTDADPVPPHRPAWTTPPLGEEGMRPGEGGMRLRHDPADPYPSAPHSADLAPLADREDVVRLGVDGPLCWHGTARLTAAVTVSTEATARTHTGTRTEAATTHPGSGIRPGVTTGAGVELVVTLVHERPDGAATRVADGTASIGPGASRCEIRLAPVAMELPPGHRLHVELTAGRPPRYPAPPQRAEILLHDVALHLPRPRKGAFA